jgi:TetR/AcrR family transcriptional regulator, transcriptional repressor of bet genes
LLIDESINFKLAAKSKQFCKGPPVPKLGMEPIRKAALVNATIAEIGQAGSLDVTVSQIAKRAGMSSALAHHYFGGKEEMFLAAMRHVLTLYGAEVRGALAMAEGPQARVEAVVRASFSAANFRREVVGAWLNFYVMAQTMPQARRLLAVYQRRLRSNLTQGLRPLVGARAGRVAEALASLIDGVYLRQVLAGDSPDRAAAVAVVLDHLQTELARGAAA